MKKIVVEIDEAGDSKIDLSGFKGQGCAKVFSDFAGEDKPIITLTKREFREQEPQKEKVKA